MNAILTKVLPATNTKGTRIKAECEGGSVIIPWNHGDPAFFNHHTAAKALCTRMSAQQEAEGLVNASIRWDQPMTYGSIKGGYAFVLPRL